MPRNDGVCFTSCSLKLTPPHPPLAQLSNLQFTPQILINCLKNPPKFPIFNFNPNNSITQFLNNLREPQKFLNSIHFRPPLKSSLLCSASLAISQSNNGGNNNAESDSTGPTQKSSNPGSSSARPSIDQERVLISEVWVRNKDGEELERKDLESEALDALKASRPNSALTVREVQEDVHRIIASGYFSSCMPVAVDTRDGIRLVFQVIYVFLFIYRVVLWMRGFFSSMISKSKPSSF